MQIKLVLEVNPTLEEFIKVFLDRLLSFEPEEFGSTESKSQPSSAAPGPAVTKAPAKAPAPSMEELKAKILEMPNGKVQASRVIKDMGLQKITDLATDDLILDFVARLGVA